MLQSILNWYPEEDIIKADGFDEAVIGIDEQSMRLIYSTSKCIEILMKDMCIEDAIEYFDYNMRGAYIGERTPIWCNDNGS